MNSETVQGIGVELSMKFENSIRTEMRITTVLDIKVLSEYLDNPMVITFIEGGVNEYLSALICAGLALGYAGKDIHSDDISRLLLASGIKQDQRVKIFLALTRLLHYRNHHAYMYATYFVKMIGKKPELELIFQIVRAMGIPPDASIAQKIMDFNITYLDGAPPAEYPSMNKGGSVTDAFLRFCAIMSNFCNIIGDFLIREMNTALQNSEVVSRIRPDIYPYIWATSPLALSGREISRDTVGALLQAVDITPEQEILDTIMLLKFKDRVVYVVMLYYLVAIEVEPDAQRLIIIMQALDIQPDIVRAQKAIDYYNEMLRQSLNMRH